MWQLWTRAVAHLYHDGFVDALSLLREELVDERVQRLTVSGDIPGRGRRGLGVE